MHACPCCGFRTLPGRGDYDLCPVCWWEVEGVEAWEFSGPNGGTLLDAQAEFLAETRPYLLRPGRVRAPRKKEARDPGWLPIERTDELLERAHRARAEYEQYLDEEDRRAARELADDPEGPFAGYNAAVDALHEQAPHLSHREVKSQLHLVSTAHGMPWDDADLELLSRLLKNENYYRHHPVRTAVWMLRYARPGTVKQRWQEVRTGTVSLAG